MLSNHIQKGEGSVIKIESDSWEIHTNGFCFTRCSSVFIQAGLMLCLKQLSVLRLGWRASHLMRKWWTVSLILSLSSLCLFGLQNTESWHWWWPSERWKENLSLSDVWPVSGWWFRSLTKCCSRVQNKETVMGNLVRESRTGRHKSGLNFSD